MGGDAVEQSGAMLHERGAGRDERLIPGGGEGGVGGAVLQQGVALLHHPLVRRHQPRVLRVELHAEIIEGAPADARRALHHIEIVGAEEHAGQNAPDARGVRLLPVALEGPARLGELAFVRDAAAVALELQERGPALGAVTQKLARRRTTERLPRREQLERLDQVGFASGVVAHQDGDPLRQVEDVLLEAAIMLYPEFARVDTH